MKASKACFEINKNKDIKVGVYFTVNFSLVWIYLNML